MAVSLVHSEAIFVAFGGTAVTPSVAPTAGNLLVMSVSTRNAGLGPSAITGWTLVSPGVQTTDPGPDFARDHAMFYRVAQTGDTGWTPNNASASLFNYAEFSDVGAFMGSVGKRVLWGVSNDSVCGGPITTTGPALIIGGEASNAGDTAIWGVDPTSPNIELADLAGGGAGPAWWMAYRIETSPGTYTVNGTVASGSTGGPPSHVGITVAFEISGAPIADFTVDLLSDTAPATANFTDLSIGIPTSWAWTFGDGGTSTLQNPSHVYTVAGDYEVSLTVTNADGSDTETKFAYIRVAADVGYEPPPPAGVLLEIYAAAPGSARWGVAKWGEAQWSSAGWQDVTPEGITVDILWGSSEPERGILHKPSADSWAINIFDPERRLDPANADGPFYTDLIPFLPVRVSHRSKVIALGFAESIGHSYTLTGPNGYMRVTNNLSRLANAQVPSDIALSDTLYARAVDAISSAGLSVQVGSPLGADPPLAPWGDFDTVPEWSAWEWIVDAAEQVRYIPIVNRRTGMVEFRPWAAPLSRGRSIDSPNLVDLSVVSEYRGLFSVISALSTVADGDTIITRALTPPPRYGARTFERAEPTIDAGDWADAVLADRALPGLRWIPGDIYPLTADDVEDFASLGAVELISMAVPEADPPVAATAIIVGGSIAIVGKKDTEAVWRFTFEAAQTAAEPLIETGGDPTDYLLATGGDQFLYPST